MSALLSFQPPSVGQQALHAAADGAQAEEGGLQMVRGYPAGIGGIVGSTDGGGRERVGGAAEEKTVGGVDVQSAEGIDVGQGEEVALYADVEARLFAHLAQAARLKRLAGIDEAAGEVEGAAGRFALAAHAEQTAGSIDDDGHGRGGGIGIEGETARHAAPRTRIVDGKGASAADGAIEEGKQRVGHGAQVYNKYIGRCVIIANLLRCYRLRAWSCTSVHSLRPHPQRLAS